MRDWNGVQSRDSDIRRLAAGEVTPEQLAKENCIFSVLPLHTFRITAVGGKPIAGPVEVEG